MGQHKYNPLAIAAKEGKIPAKEKPKKMSKIERNTILQNAVEDAMRKVVGYAPRDFLKYLGETDGRLY